MGGAEHLVMDMLKEEEHRYMAFLPLAHVLEFILEFIFITMVINSFTRPETSGSMNLCRIGYSDLLWYTTHAHV